MYNIIIAHNMQNKEIQMDPCKICGCMHCMSMYKLYFVLLNYTTLHYTLIKDECFTDRVTIICLK